MKVEDFRVENQTGGTQFIASEPVAAVALKCDPPERPAPQTCAQVMHKERGKEKGKSPYNPLKEKESQKEISAVPAPVPVHHAGAGACARAKPDGAGAGSVGLRQNNFGAGAASGVSVQIRPGTYFRVTPDFILDGCMSDGRRNDPVQVALLVLGIPQCSEHPNGRWYNNARIFRWIIPQIGGEENFRQVVYEQWRENAIDGNPRNRAAAFMAKLYAVRDEIRKERKGGEA